MKKLILIFAILFSGCSVIHKAEKIPTREANDLLDIYFETVWNPENNLPGEKRQCKKEIKKYLKTIKNKKL